jgi:two-component system CheB/CheR fusion protein
MVDWKESGLDGAGSPDASKGNGSGRRLIEDALPYQFGAQTSFAIEADGVHCTIALPISNPHEEETRNGSLRPS